MQHSLSAAARAALVLLIPLAASASAQRYLVAENDTKTVRVADLGAGALLGPVLIDVGATATPVPLSIWDAAVVDDEIWVSANDYVHRYDRTSLVYIGAIGPLVPPTRARGIDTAGGSAWIAAERELIQLSFDGVIVAQHAVVGARDVLARGAELLVSNNVDKTVERYDFSGTQTGVFADVGNIAAGANQLGRRANGNVLLVGVARVFELDPSGNLLEVIQAGFFEQGVAETSSGGLFVPSFDGPAQLYDEASGRVFPVGGEGLRFVSFLDRRPTSRRYCPASANSTGRSASVSAHGSAGLGTSDFRLLLGAVPANSIAQLIWGAAPANLPFGDGTLCVDPSSAGFVRAAVSRVDDTGVALDQVDLSTAPGDQITPGSTWHFQFVFRDAAGGSAGFNSSDAVQVTFLP